MTDWPQLIVSIGTLIGSVAAAYGSVMAVRSSQNNKAAIGAVKATADEALTVSKKTEVNTNSMSERLGLAAHAAGVAEGAAGERAKAEGLAGAEAKGRADEQAKGAAAPSTIMADQIITDKIVTKPAS